MIPSLESSDSTFSASRIRRILDECTAVYLGKSSQPDFGCNGTATNIQDKSNNERISNSRKSLAKRWSEAYHAAARDSDTPIVDMDNLVSKLVECRLPTMPTPDLVVDNVCYLLSRLPSYPLPIPGYAFQVDSDPDSRFFQHGTQPKWENMKVVMHVSTPVICQVLCIVISIMLGQTSGQSFGHGGFVLLSDTIMELLEAATELSTSANQPQDIRLWLIVRSFLWSSWQRVSMFTLWYTLHLQLQGIDYSLREQLTLRALPSASVLAQTFDNTVEPTLPAYMCRWAFRLMISERALLGFDVRRFLFRYSEAWAGCVSRCTVNATGVSSQCDGSSVENCRRFKNMVIQDQSAHTPSCAQDRSCRRLFWDELSYRSTQGARAVILEDSPNDFRLRFCEASGSTLAVSHVWSHGQGGRPELDGTGMNLCLHQRYCKIARSHNCDSYWMDTPCIPQDHQLRAEAISYINEVFANSRMTLICDRDLMSFDYGDSTHNVRKNEALLATLLVCDWNVRAWTLLEAMRGRSHAYLLCRADTVVSLKDVVRNVHSHGCIDISLLALSAQHLLPYNIAEKRSAFAVDPPEATCLLVNRHASRPGDDIVIWSLIVGSNPQFTAQDFWAARVGNIMRSGYLMSDLPRLQHVSGFSWAPSQPCLVDSAMTHNASRNTSFPRVFDGIGSSWGIITENGFHSSWDSCTICTATVTSSVDDHAPSSEAVLPSTTGHSKVGEDILSCFSLSGYHVRILRPSPHGPKRAEDLNALYCGSSGGPLVAVVSSLDRVAWTWKGTYEWPREAKLPLFEGKLMRII